MLSADRASATVPRHRKTRIRVFEPCRRRGAGAHSPQVPDRLRKIALYQYSIASDPPVSTVGGTGILRPLIVPSGTPTIGLPQYMYEQCSVGMCHGNLALPLERGYYPDEVLRATGRDLGLAVIPIGGWVNLGRAGATRATASVDDLLRMMNRRPNTQAEYASGDMLSYLRINQAEGSHMLLENGVSHIVLRQDVATRRTALHEWLHRRLQRQLGHSRPREDEIIEEFLNRHEQYFRLGN